MATAIDNTLSVPNNDGPRQGTFTKDIKKDNTYVVESDDDEMATPRSDDVEKDQQIGDNDTDATEGDINTDNNGMNGKENMDKSDADVDETTTEGRSEDSEQQVNASEQNDGYGVESTAKDGDDNVDDSAERDHKSEKGAEDKSRSSSGSITGRGAGSRPETPKGGQTEVNDDETEANNDQETQDPKQEMVSEVGDQSAELDTQSKLVENSDEGAAKNERSEHDDKGEEQSNETAVSRSNSVDGGQTGHGTRADSRAKQQGEDVDGYESHEPVQNTAEESDHKGDGEEEESSKRQASVDREDKDVEDEDVRTDNEQQEANPPIIVVEKAETEDSIGGEEKRQEIFSPEHETDKCDGNDFSTNHQENDHGEHSNRDQYNEPSVVELDKEEEEQVKGTESKSSVKSHGSQKSVTPVDFDDSSKRYDDERTVSGASRRSDAPGSRSDHDHESPPLTARSDHAIESMHHNAHSILDSIQTIQRENSRMKEENERLRTDKSDLQRKLRRATIEIEETKKELNDRIEELEADLNEALGRIMEFEDLVKTQKRRGRVSRANKRERSDFGRTETPLSSTQRAELKNTGSIPSREGRSVSFSRVESFLRADIDRLEKYNATLEQTLKAEIEKRHMVQQLLEDVMATNEAFKMQFEKWNETEEKFEKLKTEHAELQVKYRHATERKGNNVNGAGLELLPYKKTAVPNAESKLGKGDIWERIEATEVELKDSKQRVQVLEDYLKRLYNGDLQIMIKPAVTSNSDKVPFLPSIEDNKPRVGGKTYAGLAARKRKFKYGNPT